MEKRERNIRIFGLILLLAGIGLSLWGAFVGVQAWLTTTWPTTDGTIVAARVEERVNVNATAVEEDVLDYEPVVQYTYTVDGETHTADNIRYFDDEVFGERADAEAYLNRYQSNDQVTVYYHSDDAEEALLEPDVARTTFIPLGFGLFGLVSGLLFVLRPDLV